jgi:hypothetical protein
MAEQKYDKDVCIALLREKQQSLAAQGFSRFPQRNDFNAEAIVAIKAFLGPWPRALEAAGIKQPRISDHKLRTREKHIRAKQKRNAAKKAQKMQKSSMPASETESDISKLN